MDTIYQLLFTNTVESSSPYLWMLITIAVIATLVFIIKAALERVLEKTTESKGTSTLWDNLNDHDYPTGI